MMTSVSRINIVQEMMSINMLHGIQWVDSTKGLWWGGWMATKVMVAIGVAGCSHFIISPI